MLQEIPRFSRTIIGKTHHEGRIHLSTSKASLQEAINLTLSAVAEGREQVETIAVTTREEVERLMRDFEQLKMECVRAIEQVETLEVETRRARDRLMVVNRDIKRNSEKDMQQAYEKAERLQTELVLWRERESQLRVRRDEVSRRLKSLQATAHQAELLMVKFQHISGYLSAEFQGVFEAVSIQHAHHLIGIRMLQIQEDERTWLAQKLHDGPMQSLASVAMRVQAQSQVPEAEAALLRDDVRVRIGAVISDLRQVVFDLRPPLLDDLGLVPTLKRYAEQWSKKTQIGIRIHMVGIEVPLASTQKVTIFRMVQEGLKNVEMHAGATMVDLTLTYRQDGLHILLADDGVGISSVHWDTWLEEGKMGLVLCRERLAALGGTVDIAQASAGAQGATLSILIPLQQGGGR